MYNMICSVTRESIMLCKGVLYCFVISISGNKHVIAMDVIRPYLGNYD